MFLRCRSRNPRRRRYGCDLGIRDDRGFFFRCETFHYLPLIKEFKDCTLNWHYGKTLVATPLHNKEWILISVRTMMQIQLASSSSHALHLNEYGFYFSLSKNPLLFRGVIIMIDLGRRRVRSWKFYPFPTLL